jgi:hypothetical protein
MCFVVQLMRIHMRHCSTFLHVVRLRNLGLNEKIVSHGCSLCSYTVPYNNL